MKKEERVSIRVSMTKDERRELKLKAIQENKSVSMLVYELIRNELEGKER